MIFLDWIRDDDYTVSDMNGDGFKDFVWYYHNFDDVHPFDPVSNTFSEKNFLVPAEHELVKGCRNLFWGWFDAAYGEQFDCSYLYTYRKGQPWYLYKIVFASKEMYTNRADANRIELYCFIGGNGQKPVFVRTISTKNPATFDYKRFWESMSRKLTGYR